MQLYFYRRDLLKCLRAQRGDPVLRARRVEGPTGIFDHGQAIEELTCLPPGHGVYRMSFWKSWDAAHRHFTYDAGIQGPWVVQRVRVDQPLLCQFKRDDDEYLADDAWIFWKTMEIDPARPAWSAVGIAHADIEVLHPHGYWEPLSVSSMLSDERTYLGWERHYLSGYGSGPCPAYVNTCLRRADDKMQVWILIRQPSGPWTTLLHNDDLVAQIAERQLPKLQDLSRGQVRWVMSAEFDDRVIAYEFIPTLRFAQPRTLPDRLRAWLGSPPGISVFIDAAQKRTLNQDEVNLLYLDFGIADVLRLQERWKYAEGLLDRVDPNKGR